MKHIFQRYFYTVGLLGLCIGVVSLIFEQAIRHVSALLIYGDDIHRQYYFFRQYINESLQSGVFPWWNPYNFNGAPFIADPITNIWYPLNWLFIFLPLTVAYVLHLMLHIVNAQIGMYWLSRKFNAPIPSMGAAIAFGLSGFFVARTWAGHVDVIAAASYMPWVFGMFFEAIRSGAVKKLLFASCIFALQLFSGYQTMAFFTLEAIGFLTLYFCVRQKSLKPLRIFVIGCIIGVCLAGLHIIPEQEFFRRSIRTYDFPYSWNEYGSMTFESLKQLASPFYFGDQHSYTGPKPNYPEQAGFISRVGLGLMLIAILFTAINVLLFRSKKTKANRSLVVVFSIIALFGLWISLGKQAPIDLQYIVWRFIPMYQYLRIPPRHLILFIFGASILVGFGLSFIRNRIVQTVLVSVMLVELVIYGHHFIEVSPVPETRHDPSLIKLLTHDDQPHRVLQNFGVWLEARDSFDFDAAMSYRVFSATGYDPSILKNYYEFIDAVNKNVQPSILTNDVQVPYLNMFSPYINFLNIKYLMLLNDYDPLEGKSNQQFTLIKEDAVRKYRVYENNMVLPRFFFISNLVKVSDREQVLSTIRKGEVNLSTTALVNHDAISTELINGSCTNQDSDVHITLYTPNRIDINTKNICDSVLISSEVYYPGWEALIDGKKTNIFEANAAFRSIIVPKGSHTVTFRYNPKIFYFSGLLSITTVFCCVVLWYRKRNVG